MKLIDIKPIFESVENPPEEQIIPWIEEIRDLMKPLLSKSLIWRGFKRGSGWQPVFKVKNDRREFLYRAGSLDQVSAAQKEDGSKLLRGLKIHRPVFTTMDNQQSVFGELYVFVPPKNYKAVWSPKVKDITIEKVENNLDLLPTYHVGIPDSKIEQEIIFDCEEYFMVDYQRIIHFYAGKEWKRKYDSVIWDHKISSVWMKTGKLNSHISTYKDLDDILAIALKTLSKKKSFSK
jgi:hypothetical protein